MGLVEILLVFSFLWILVVGFLSHPSVEVLDSDWVAGSVVFSVAALVAILFR